MIERVRGVIVSVLWVLCGCGRRNFNDDAAPPPIDARACTDLPAGCAGGEVYACAGVCFAVCPINMSRPAGAATCNEWGGCLATIKSRAQNDCAASRIRSDSWIGGLQPNTATTLAGGWAWCDGSPFGFDAWGPASPDDSQGIEDGEQQCVQINPGGNWSDLGCSQAQQVVCSRPL